MITKFSTDYPGPFGVGRGYRAREVKTFGAPIMNQEAKRELFEDISFKTFNSETFLDRGYRLKEQTAVSIA